MRRKNKSADNDDCFDKNSNADKNHASMIC